MKLRAGIAAAAIVFSACSTPTSSGSPSTSAAGPLASTPGTSTPAVSGKGEIQIWSEGPRQGSRKTQTDTIVNAIKMAIDERDATVDGWTIKYVDQDDSTADVGDWTEERAIAIATEASGTSDLVGYLGPFNSGAATNVIPILCRAGLVMISPSNSYPGLTKPSDLFAEAGEPDKYYPGCTHNYFRVIQTEDLQGEAAAGWAAALGATKVYVLHDASKFGIGMANVFEASVTKLGLAVLDNAQATLESGDFKALATAIAKGGPQLVYYGTDTSDDAGQLWKDLRQAMPKVALIGPDALNDEAFLQDAGGAAEGTYLTFNGTPEAAFTSDAAKVRDDFVAKYGGGLVKETIYSYEATNVMLDAIETASKAGAGTSADLRAAVLKAVAATKDYEGVLGTWSFDANGDTSLKDTWGTEVTSGKFTFVKVPGS